MKKLYYRNSKVCSEIAGEETLWQATVQVNGSLTEDNVYAALAEMTGMSEERVRYVFACLYKLIVSNLREGNTLSLGFCSFRLVCQGGFMYIDSAFDPEKNTITVKVNLSKKLRNCMEGVEPVNLTEPPSPKIHTVGDSETGAKGILTPEHVVFVNGLDLAPDASRDDERCWLENLDGTVAAEGTITKSDLQIVNVTFAEWPDAGKYRFCLSTRSGLSTDFSLQTVTKDVEVTVPDNSGNGGGDDDDDGEES